MDGVIYYIGTLSRIWNEEGIRGLYRGLGPTIFGYLPTWAIYFTVYDYCKAHWGRKYGNANREGGRLWGRKY